jgi:hypothetical protein
VCVDVPSAIYTIPPNCPIYNVRYCYVYDYSPDWVHVGYLPGYTGCYVYGPCVVYGTGYYYPGWYGGVYIARPWTWGFDFRFDLFTGFWGCGPGFFFGHPRFFDHHYHPGWWGPGGFHDFHEFRGFDRFHDGFRGHFPGELRRGFRPGVGVTDIYRRSENVHRNFDERATIGRTFQGRSPGQANNVYAGHDGRVYRRSNDGWEERGRAGWSRMNAVPEDRGLGRARATPRPQPEFHQPPPPRTPSGYSGLEADHFARMQGMDRARSFGGDRGGSAPAAEHNAFVAPRGGGGGRGGGGFGGGGGHGGGGGGGRR